MNRLINILILIAMSLSIAHGVVFNMHNDEHCTAQEFSIEMSQPLVHDGDSDDMCSIHFIFHLSFLVPEEFYLPQSSNHKEAIYPLMDFYPLSFPNNSFRPPIS